MTLRERVYDAVLVLCRERSYEEIGLGDIAERAGVDEAAVHEVWPAKNLVVMESLLHAVAPHMRFPRTGGIRADLEAQLAAVTRLFADPGIGPHLAAVIADIHADPRLADAFLRQVYTPNRAVARARFELAQEQGQVRLDIDLDTAVDLVFGPIWFRLLLGTGPLTPQLAASIADHALTGLGVGAAGHHREVEQA
ncbi:TetR/AcrR family transcriptional regulator C-terminal ligand-binding domain-containing protein [Streptomyces sp. O3]